MVFKLNGNPHTGYSAERTRQAETVPNTAALIPKEKFLSRRLDKIQWADWAPPTSAPRSLEAGKFGFLIRSLRSIYLPSSVGLARGE